MTLWMKQTWRTVFRSVIPLPPWKISVNYFFNVLRKSGRTRAICTSKYMSTEISNDYIAHWITVANTFKCWKKTINKRKGNGKDYNKILKQCQITAGNHAQ